MAFSIESFSFNLPFGIGGVSVRRTEEQARAAWALYVELATRVSHQRLEPRLGSAREALTSIYSLFETTRTVLRTEGPRTVDGPGSVGPLAIRVLNEGVRPFLVKWHSELSAFEDQQREAWFKKYGGNAKPVIDESAWEHLSAFYEALEEWRGDMLDYVAALAKLAGV
ncbi:MAG: hypothetical protein AAF196_08265 [Planctomycetota bacterium]